MSDPPRKYQDKEAFVTGHSGSTFYEILLLCMVIPLGLNLYCKLLPFFTKDNQSNTKLLGLEFVTLLLPMLVVQTNLLDNIIAGHAMLLSGMALLSLLVPYQQLALQKDMNMSRNEIKRPTFLSIHRSSVYLLTTIAILAVDFPLFPRKYCKTEVCGYGWMDLGAASFVIIAGWTSSLSSSDNAKGGTSTGPEMMYYRAAKKCAPLLLIGLIRLITNKGLEYQEHVSEYGVHWNFFFTLCFIEGFMVVWKSRMKHVKGIPMDGIIALSTMMTYQFYLSAGGQEFIENGMRRCSSNPSDSWSMCDVMYANREGILGLVGYISLRLLSEQIGRFCLVYTTSILKQQRLLITTLALWVIHLVLTVGLQIPTSRRSTNLPFIIWALAHNMTILSFIYYVTNTYSQIYDNKPLPMPCILNAVNGNGLAVFLLSNVLTGLVNLTLDTLHASDTKAILVLFIYLGLVCGATLSLDKLLTNKNNR